jgi:WD40 repeat protein
VLQSGEIIDITSTGYDKMKIMHLLENDQIAIGRFGFSDIGIWNLESKRIVGFLIGHLDEVNTLLDMGHGNLASGSSDRTIKIWNYREGKILKTLRGHTSLVWKLSLINESTLASCSADKTIIIWNVKNGRVLRTLKGHNIDVKSLVLISSGQLASGSLDWKINIWNVNTGSLIRTLYGNTGDVQALVHLGDHYMASGSFDGSIIIWNVQLGKKNRHINHGGVVNSLVLLKNGLLACNYKQNKIKIWNYTSGQLAQTLHSQFEFTSCLISHENGNLLSLVKGGAVLIWSFSNKSNYTGFFSTWLLLFK